MLPLLLQLHQVGERHAFECKDDAEQFLVGTERMNAEVPTEMRPEKTRLIEFGRHATANGKHAGLGKPETFDFLGFTHICGKPKKGRFMVLRQNVVSLPQRYFSRCAGAFSNWNTLTNPLRSET